MTLYARFFNKRNEMAIDVPLQVTFMTFMANVRTDGALITEAAYLPLDQIALVLAFEAGEVPPKGAVLQMVPKPEGPQS